MTTRVKLGLAGAALLLWWLSRNASAAPAKGDGDRNVLGGLTVECDPTMPNHGSLACTGGTATGGDQIPDDLLNP